MSADSNRTERGEAMFDLVYGGVVPLPARDTRSPYVAHTIDHLFGEIWPRDVLTLEQRRLLILGAVIALGEEGIAEIQVTAALAKGELSVEQAEEIRLFMVHYVGHPRISSFSAALARAVAAHTAQQNA